MVWPRWPQPSELQRGRRLRSPDSTKKYFFSMLNLFYHFDCYSAIGVGVTQRDLYLQVGEIRFRQ